MLLTRKKCRFEGGTVDSLAKHPGTRAKYEQEGCVSNMNRKGVCRIGLLRRPERPVCSLPPKPSHACMVCPYQAAKLAIPTIAGSRTSASEDTGGCVRRARWVMYSVWQGILVLMMIKLTASLQPGSQYSLIKYLNWGTSNTCFDDRV